MGSTSIAFVGLEAQRRRLRSQIENRLKGVLDHGQFVNGPEIAELETRLTDFCGAGDCVGLSSGTDALLVALMAAGVGPGDRVLVPAFTFPATAEVVLLTGATPVFVDVEAETTNISSATVRAALEKASDGAAPKALIAVDLFGLPADYSELEPLCDERGMLLIDDAAQSFGAQDNGRRVGTLAPVTATSFFPAKPLGAYGDGGALFCRDAEDGVLYRSIREHGQGKERYDVARVGLNARLDSFQAAVLLVKLDVFAEELERREALAQRYDRCLEQIGGVSLPARRGGVQSAWAQYTIQVDDRDEVRAELDAGGVPTAVYYPRPLHFQPAYVDHGDGPGSLPVAESVCERVLSLPMNPYLEDADVDQVCAVLESVLGS